MGTASSTSSPDTATAGLASSGAIGDGTFVHIQDHNFVHEPLDMVVGDFDKDGDLDIAGVGFESDIAIVENEGDLFERPRNGYKRHHYRPDRIEIRWSQDISVVDYNEDGHLDLIAGSDAGNPRPDRARRE